jgi:hypothetical protein
MTLGDRSEGDCLGNRKPSVAWFAREHALTWKIIKVKRANEIVARVQVSKLNRYRSDK